MRANFVVLHQAPQELVVRFDISLPRAMTRAAGLDRCRRFAHAICDAATLGALDDARRNHAIPSACA